MSNTHFDVCIRGSGVVGCALALALGQAKLRVALVEQAPSTSDALNKPKTERDIRAYALNQASRQLLETLRCWPASPATTPVQHMHVFGDAGGTVRFDANAAHAPWRGTRQVGSAPAPAPLGWIADVPTLEDQLAQALHFQPHVERVNAPVDATLTAICEGKFSTSRADLGIAVKANAYPQHAIATRIRANQPHQGTASQWFYGPHILGLLPLGGELGDEYAVVWSTSVAEADRLLALDDAAFAQELQTLIAHASQRHQGRPGFAPPITSATTFALTGARARWPLRLTQAQQWAGLMPETPNAPNTPPNAPERAWVLLGDAAHTVHPLTGSGLNLGLGDAAALARILQQRPAWRSVAERRLLRSYERERKAALLPYAMLTDSLQWLFWQERPWLQSLRNWGMNQFASSPLKSWAARRVRHT